MNALSPRGLFFRNAPQLLPPIPIAPETHGLLWWVCVVAGVWFLVSILYGLIIWPIVVNLLRGQRTAEDDDIQAQELKELELRDWFKKNRKDNKAEKKGRLEK